MIVEHWHHCEYGSHPCGYGKHCVWGEREREREREKKLTHGKKIKLKTEFEFEPQVARKTERMIKTV
jgi:hypothetical protein